MRRRRRNQLNYPNIEPESRLDSDWTTAQDPSSAGDTDMYFVRAWRSDDGSRIVAGASYHFMQDGRRFFPDILDNDHTLLVPVCS